MLKVTLNVVMKVTNEKKIIFSFNKHNINKKNLLKANSIAVDLMFRLKFLIINISKDTHHEYE